MKIKMKLPLGLCNSIDINHIDAIYISTEKDHRMVYTEICVFICFGMIIIWKICFIISNQPIASIVEHQLVVYLFRSSVHRVGDLPCRRLFDLVISLYDRPIPTWALWWWSHYEMGWYWAKRTIKKTENKEKCHHFTDWKRKHCYLFWWCKQMLVTI